MTPDMVNSSFVFISGALLSLNIRRIWQDKKVKGVSPWPVAFFFAWGGWDFYYYPHLDQWYSLTASVVATLFNGAWLVLWYKYRNNE